MENIIEKEILGNEPINVTIILSENNSFDVYKHIMRDIKVNDFWAWLNKMIPVGESRKLLDIVDCDYKRQMIQKYSKKYA